MSYYSRRLICQKQDASCKETVPPNMIKRNSSRAPTDRPIGLRGKAIGLYYRDKARNKRKQRDNQQFLHLNSQDFIINTSICNLVEGPALKNRCNLNFDIRYSRGVDPEFKRKFLNITNGNLLTKLEYFSIMKPILQSNENVDKELLDELNKTRDTEEYKRILEFRKKLPAYKNKEEVLDVINANQVVLISGETGCGKTTQISQIILDYEIEHGRGSTTCIACTQPRRIATISVAERVAVERADVLGNSVGYCMRLEKIPPRSVGSIVFCTTGTLLQFVQKDPALRKYSHIILDEIHERSVESDFILVLLKLIMQKRSDLKIILMSATLNAEQFSVYYDNCPTLHIPGYTYPVKELYLEDVLQITGFKFPELDQQKSRNSLTKREGRSMNLEMLIDSFYKQDSSDLPKYPDSILQQLYDPESELISYDLICDLIKHICKTEKSGAILVFLPGSIEIRDLNTALLGNKSFPRDKYVIYPLHSLMPTVDQKQIFSVPPPGIRKIIISTDIAETSVTVKDVVFVIDCGKNKVSNFDVETNMQTLDQQWISTANSLQRKGRAGRVQPGICYYLYTRARAGTFKAYPLPAIRRTRLEELILRMKLLQIGKVDIFLSTMLDPPDPKVISLSLDLLRQLNALDENENLTPLGFHLSKLPLDPQTGKMIIWAALFSCVEPIFAIAASLSYKDAFYFPLEKNAEVLFRKIELGLNQHSDQLALSEALRSFEKIHRVDEQKCFCEKYFLSWNTLKLLSKMKKQFATYLYEMKFLNNDNPRDPSANINSNNTSLIKAIVCAGLYPNIAVIQNYPQRCDKVITLEKESVAVHPSSVNVNIKSVPSPYFTYFLKRRSTRIFLFCTSSVSSTALIFASPKISLIRNGGKDLMVLLNKIGILGDTEKLKIIKKLHEHLNYVIELKICRPGLINWNSEDGLILKAIIKLISDNDSIPCFQLKQ